jgi:nucleoside-diphosphate-sugar epimerase
MKRVLVTGATGTIGRHALPILLGSGWDVVAVHNRQSAPADAKVSWRKADLLDADEVHRLAIDAQAPYLLHLAWYTAPGRWADAQENVDWAIATGNLVREFKREGGRRVVGAGSCMEYDWSHGVCAEGRTPLESTTLYGRCKHVAQQLTAALMSGSDLSSAWGRVFFLYGPYENPTRLVPSVIRALLAGTPARTSHGRQVRDYLHAADVASALVRLLESSVTGPVNIGSGEPVTLREIVLRVGALVGRPDLIELGAIPPAPTDAPVVVADMTHARERLGWAPAFDLERGLTDTIEWWRHQVAESRAFS